MPPRSATLGKQGHWLLLLVIGGQPYRFATKPLSITRDNGRSDRWEGGLEDMEIGRNETSVAVGVAAGVDWALLAARGVDVAAGHATLYRYFDDQVLEEAEVYRSGRVSKPEYDTAADPLAFSIVEEPWQDAVVIPDPAMTVDDRTFPVTASYAVDPPALGQIGPIILGRPGLGGFSGAGIPHYSELAAVSPAFLVEFADGAHLVNDSRLLIAYHEVQAPTVWVYDLSDGSSEEFDVLHDVDLLGRKYAYVTFTTSLFVRPWAGHEYRVAWSGGGGIYNADRTGALRGLGELLVYLLCGRVLGGQQQTAIRIDRGRQLTQAPRLDTFKIDAVINERIGITSWIDRNLASIMPMTWHEREAAYIHWKYDATAKDAVAVLDVDRGQLSPVGPARVVSDQVFNRFVLDYAPGGDGSHLKRMVLTGNVAAEDGDDAEPNWLCQISQQREARRMGGNGVRTWTCATDVVSDPATARQVLLHKARRHAVPPIEANYRGESELERLRTGDVVLLNHAARYWVERVALVKDVITGGPQPELELEVLADPSRILRRTS